MTTFRLCLMKTMKYICHGLYKKSFSTSKVGGLFMCNIFCHGEDIILDEFLKVDHRVIHKQALKK